MRAILTLIILVSFCNLGNAHQSHSVNVTFLIIDWQPMPIDKVLVIVLPSSTPHPWGLNSEERMTTDRDGKVIFRLKPGFYDVFVSRSGFTPRAAKIEVLEDKPAKFKLVLKMDPNETFPD
jgi:hypothetical protein